MDNLVLLIVLLLVALVALPIIALVTSSSRARELRAEMANLSKRVWDMESRLSGLAAGRAEGLAALTEPAARATVQALQPAPLEVEQAPIAVEAPQASPTLRQAEPIPQPPPPAVPVAAPQFRSVEPAAASDTPSLESRIGSQWFNRIGILAVLIGVAWFLKLAFDNHWIGPLGRILIGLLAGAALIAWSERFHRRGYAVFSYSLKAIGSGTLYLSLWAAFQLYGLIPAGAAFAAMIAVTAFNGYMAWIQDAELLALYAIAGGLSTPLLVSTGGNHEVTLFTYLLMLDLAVLVLVTLRPWSRLLFGAFVGTVLFIFGWWTAFYTQSQAPRTALFLGCFFLLFALAPRLVRLTVEPGGTLQAWDGLASFGIPVANAALGFLAFYSLLSPATADWSAPWLAVAFAAFYLLLMRLPETGILQRGAPALASLHLTAAVVFLTIAIPLKTHGRWLTIGWLVEGAVLLWLSRRLRSALLRVFGVLSTVLGLGALLLVNPPAAIRPIFNERFGTYCVAIAVCAFIAWLGKHAQDESEAGGYDAAPILPWRSLAAVAVIAMNVLILLALSLEIHSYWWFERWHGYRPYYGRGYRNYYAMREYWMYAQFSYSALFMLYGGILLAVGFVRRSAFLRWQALILMAATVAKVFLVDISQLSRGFRILSFMGLGVLLLGVSYVYQRDWLNLRERKESQ
ncbi:MAG: DUF2339 domain-containing protein [Terracidiphilus sp.]|jgi:uncharacterized membrane protein